jgi:hypothetical protein
VPEPESLFLLGTGFGALAIGVAATTRRRAAELTAAAAWTSASDEE